MTPDDFRKGMAVLLATWPKEATTVETLTVYEQVTSHLDGDVWLGAVKQCVMTCTFFPKPAELLAAAVSLTHGPQRTGLDAWGDVKRAIAKYGYYHPPNGASMLAVGGYDWTFEDALVGKVVAALGWRDLCLSENEMSDRARFIDAYETEQRRGRDQARLTPDLIQLQSGKQADARRLLGAVTERMGRR